MYTTVKLWKFQGRATAAAVRIVNKKQELSKSKREIGLSDEVGEILQVVRIAAFWKELRSYVMKTSNIIISVNARTLFCR
jgi:hypothetical protein